MSKHEPQPISCFRPLHCPLGTHVPLSYPVLSCPVLSCPILLSLLFSVCFLPFLCLDSIAPSRHAFSAFVARSRSKNESNRPLVVGGTWEMGSRALDLPCCRSGCGCGRLFSLLINLDILHLSCHFFVCSVNTRVYSLYSARVPLTKKDIVQHTPRKDVAEFSLSLLWQQTNVKKKTCPTRDSLAHFSCSPLSPFPHFTCIAHSLFSLSPSPTPAPHIYSPSLLLLLCCPIVSCRVVPCCGVLSPLSPLSHLRLFSPTPPPPPCSNYFSPQSA